MYKSIDPTTLHAMLDQADPPVLLDVRGADEVARGCLSGARHLPLGELPRRYVELSPQQPMVVYCLSGTRSASACRFLAERGFGELYNLEGGIAAWARAGYPIAG